MPRDSALVLPPKSTIFHRAPVRRLNVMSHLVMVRAHFAVCWAFLPGLSTADFILFYFGERSNQLPALPVSCIAWLYPSLVCQGPRNILVDDAGNQCLVGYPLLRRNDLNLVEVS